MFKKLMKLIKGKEKDGRSDTEIILIDYATMPSDSLVRYLCYGHETNTASHVYHLVHDGTIDQILNTIKSDGGKYNIIFFNASSNVDSAYTLAAYPISKIYISGTMMYIDVVKYKHAFRERAIIKNPTSKDLDDAVYNVLINLKTKSEKQGG